jgi:hypothetical protein
VVVTVCIVNIAIAVHSTRNLDGSKPSDLDRRYGELRPLLTESRTAAYVTGNRWRFLNARYALAPTVFDHRFVKLEDDGRTIATFDVDGMVARAQNRPPLTVLCDFDQTSELTAFLDELSAAARSGGFGVNIIHRRGGVALVRLGA